MYVPYLGAKTLLLKGRAPLHDLHVVAIIIT